MEENLDFFNNVPFFLKRSKMIYFFPDAPDMGEGQTSAKPVVCKRENGHNFLHMCFSNFNHLKRTPAKFIHFCMFL